MQQKFRVGDTVATIFLPSTPELIIATRRFDGCLYYGIHQGVYGYGIQTIRDYMREYGSGDFVVHPTVTLDVKVWWCTAKDLIPGYLLKIRQKIGL